MKKYIIIILASIPFLALSQRDSYNKNFNERYVTPHIEFEKHLVGISNNLETHIETTLVYDITYYKSAPNFGLNKPNKLSYIVNNNKIFNFHDNHELDEMLFEIKPLNGAKSKFIKPIEPKSLFKNLRYNNSLFGN